MRSNKVLFTVLYLLGAGLIAALFLLFVPAESRTNVKWMNLFIVYFVYTGIWGKYSLFYSSLERFSDNVPTLAMYWLSFGAYAVLAVAAMVVFWLLGVGFEKQALLQGCLLFGFVVCVGIGMGASNFLSGETARVQEQVGGMREIQRRSGQLKISLGGLPPGYSFARSEFDKVLEAVTYVGGCNNPQAREAESQILSLLDRLQGQILVKAAADDCLATVRSLEAAVALRKSISNV